MTRGNQGEQSEFVCAVLSALHGKTIGDGLVEHERKLLHSHNLAVPPGRNTVRAVRRLESRVVVPRNWKVGDELRFQDDAQPALQNANSMVSHLTGILLDEVVKQATTRPANLGQLSAEDGQSEFALAVLSALHGKTIGACLVEHEERLIGRHRRDVQPALGGNTVRTVETLESKVEIPPNWKVGDELPFKRDGETPIKNANSLVSYLKGILHNHVREQVREELSRLERNEELIEAGKDGTLRTIALPVTMSFAEAAEVELRFRQAFKKLSPRERAVVRLLDFYAHQPALFHPAELTSSTLAHTLDTPAASVRSDHRRGLKHLRKAMRLAKLSTEEVHAAEAVLGGRIMPDEPQALSALDMANAVPKGLVESAHATSRRIAFDALMELDLEYKIALILWLWEEDYGVPDLATVFGKPEMSVRDRVHNALEQFSAYIRGLGLAAPGELNDGLH